MGLSAIQFPIVLFDQGKWMHFAESERKVGWWVEEPDIFYKEYVNRCFDSLGRPVHLYWEDKMVKARLQSEKAHPRFVARAILREWPRSYGEDSLADDLKDCLDPLPLMLHAIKIDNRPTAFSLWLERVKEKLWMLYIGK